MNAHDAVTASQGLLRSRGFRMTLVDTHNPDKLQLIVIYCLPILLSKHRPISVQPPREAGQRSLGSNEPSDFQKPLAKIRIHTLGLRLEVFVKSVDVHSFN